HLGKAVAEVRVTHLVESDGILVVRIDGQKRHAARLVFRDHPRDPPLVGLRGRTVIRGENEHENGRRRERRRRVFAAVHPGQLEVGQRRAERQQRTVGGGRQRRGRGDGQGEEQSFHRDQGWKTPTRPTKIRNRTSASS